MLKKLSKQSSQIFKITIRSLNINFSFCDDTFFTEYKFMLILRYLSVSSLFFWAKKAFRCLEILPTNT